MRKYVALSMVAILALTLGLAVAGCGSKSSTESTPSSSTPAPESSMPASDSTMAPMDTAMGGGH